jgi:hypothetical protein
MKVIDLFEARRNPKQNITPSVLKQLRTIAGQHPNAFVTFTFVRKFGINPKSIWAQTPLGICAYPISYVIDREGKVPFGAEHPYIHVFESKNMDNILNVAHMGDQSVIKRLTDGFNQAMPLASHPPAWIIKDQYQNQAAINWDRLWSGITQAKHHDSYAKKGYNVLFRQVFTAAGYDGIIDNGNGIIHSNEPTQAIFFNIKNLKIIDLIFNKLPDTIDPGFLAPITNGEQWKARLERAIKRRSRDKGVESNASKFYNFIDAPLSKYDTSPLVTYTNVIGAGRIPVLEPLILQSNGESMFQYAIGTIGGRWPEAEHKIEKDSGVEEKYKNYLRWKLKDNK